MELNLSVLQHNTKRINNSAEEILREVKFTRIEVGCKDNRTAAFCSYRILSENLFSANKLIQKLLFLHMTSHKILFQPYRSSPQMEL